MAALDRKALIGMPKSPEAPIHVKAGEPLPEPQGPLEEALDVRLRPGEKFDLLRIHYAKGAYVEEVVSTHESKELAAAAWIEITRRKLGVILGLPADVRV